jgi:hypothetical protein
MIEEAENFGAVVLKNLGVDFRPSRARSSNRGSPAARRK